MNRERGKAVGGSIEVFAAVSYGKIFNKSGSKDAQEKVMKIRRGIVVAGIRRGAWCCSLHPKTGNKIWKMVALSV